MRVFVLLLLSGMPFWPGPTVQGNYCILEDSRLYLNGTSNVTDFSCACGHHFGSYSYRLTPTGAASVAFQDTYLSFPSKTLDCGRKPINKDMYETLQAEDHPNVQIQILEAKPLSGSRWSFSASAWTDLRVKAKLTIAGTSKTMWLDIAGQEVSSHVFHFKGSQPISLSSFCLEPPRPLGGLIKVEDCVEIFFDLKVEV